MSNKKQPVKKSLTKRKRIITDPNEPIWYNDHQYKTRRDFFKAGALATGSFVMMNSPMQMALAQNCPSIGGTGGTAGKVIILDLGGGQNMIGSDAMVGGPGGQLDFRSPAAYEQLGLPPSMAPSIAGQVDTSIGGFAHHADSPSLRGMNSVTGFNNALKNNMTGIVLAGTSSNDTNNNIQNPWKMFYKAGFQGSLLNATVGDNGAGGGRQQPNMTGDSVIDALTSTQVVNPQQAMDLSGGGNASNKFGGLLQNIMNAAANLTHDKLMKLGSTSTTARDIRACTEFAAEEITTLFTPQAMNPQADPALNDFNFGDNMERAAASVAKLVLDGYGNVGIVEEGGYDYHNGTRATGEQRDEKVGRIIGKLMVAAAAKGVPLCILCLSDGSVVPSSTIDNSPNGRGKYEWAGDSGSRAGMRAYFYNPVGAITMVNPGDFQIGQINTGGTVENVNVTSSNCTAAAEAMALNILHFFGYDATNFSNLFPNHLLGTNYINDFLKIA